MSPLSDVARFCATDTDVVVAASLACPLCLCTGPVEARPALEGYDPSVSCRCSSCEAQWRVYLTPEQALRLGLMHAHA